MRIKITASKAVNQNVRLVVIALMLLTGIFTLKGPPVSQATMMQQDKLELISGNEVAAHRVIVFRSAGFPTGHMVPATG